MVHVEGGELPLEPTAHAIARVQALVRQYVPEGVSLTDELLAERRAEAEQKGPSHSGLASRENGKG